MDIRKMILVCAVFMILISSVSMVSAGWFDNNVEADTFKFEGIDGFSDNDADVENGVQLVSDDSSLMNTITVREIEKTEYDTIVNSESPASLFVDMNVTEYKNGEQVSSGSANFDVLKKYDENGVKVVVEEFLTNHIYTTGTFEKDGSYYCIQIMGSDSPDKDIQIVKDIHDSLEKI